MQCLFPPNLPFFALLCGTGAGPVKISPLPVGTILSFVSRDRAIWSGFFSWFWCAFFFLLLWHVPASRVWDSQLCSPLCEFQWYPSEWIPSKSCQNSTRQFPACQPWSVALQWSSPQCHPVATETPLQQGLNLGLVGEWHPPSLKFSLFLSS